MRGEVMKSMGVEKRCGRRRIVRGGCGGLHRF
jgi:hypothetical protein